MSVPVRQQVLIDRFVSGLREIPEDGFTLAGVHDYLSGTPIDAGSLEPYLHFRKDAYTRNLVFKCELFEVLVICWDIGQHSRIHDHYDQKCWMSVPIGKLKAQNYRVLERDTERRTCRLETSQAFLLGADRPMRVDKDEPVHQILNLTGYRQQAASVHIYSRPFDSCEIYSIEDGTYSDASLHYDSMYGHPC